MKNKPKEFVAVLLSEELNDVLRLQAILMGSQKSKMLRGLIQQHAENNNWTIETLTEQYAQYAYSQWYIRFRGIRDFDAQLIRIEDELKTKYKLKPSLITIILKKCKEQQKNQLKNK